MARWSRLVAAAAAAACASARAMPRKFEGVNINWLLPDFMITGLSGTGDDIVKIAKRFENETGATINMVGKCFPHCVRLEVDTDLSGMRVYDIMTIFGNWMPEYADMGELYPLRSIVKNKAQELAWSDLLPMVRQGVCEYDGEVYLLPADGDTIFMLYRKDILDYHGLRAPATWDEWIEVAKYFVEQVTPEASADLVAGPGTEGNLSQQGGYGACFLANDNENGFATFITFLSSYLLSKGPSQGIFFNPETMMPLFNTTAVRQVLPIWKELLRWSNFRTRPGACNTTTGYCHGSGVGDSIGDYVNGKCVMQINYPGPIKFIGANTAFNTADQKMTSGIIPGTARVAVQVPTAEGGPDYDLELRDCTPEICPHAEQRDSKGRLVNRAIYLAGGGTAHAVSSASSPQVREASIEFLTLLISPDEQIKYVANPDYLSDPFRTSTLTGMGGDGNTETAKLFEKHGWRLKQQDSLAETLNYHFNSPNLIFDLRILKSGSMLAAVDAIWLDYVNNVIDEEECIRRLTINWKAAVEEVGLREQRELYRKNLGLPEFKELCDAGQQPTNLGECGPCERGTSQPSASIVPCARCSRGTYQDQTGQTACKSCEQQLTGSTTWLLAAQSADDCVCNAGSYVDHAQGACLGCPEGMTCDGSDAMPRLLPGYWNDPQRPLWVFRCLSKESCPGQEKAGDPVCKGKLAGINCGLCPEGWAQCDEGCCECDGKALLIWIVGFIVLCLGVCGLTWATSRNVGAASGVVQAAVVLTSVALGASLSFIQALGVFHRLSFKWGPPFKDLLQGFSAFLFDFGMLQLGCILKESFASKYLGSLLMLPIIAIAVLLTKPLSALLHRATESRFPNFQVPKMLCTFGTLTQALYIGVCTSVIAPLDCYASPNGEKTMRVMPSVVCGSPEHSEMIPVLVLGLLLLVLLPTSGMVFLVFRAPSAANSGMVREAGRFLWFRFRPSKWWFCLVLLLRSLLLALVSVVCPDDAHAQFMLIFFILTWSLSMQLTHLPCKLQSGNRLDILLTALLLSILALASWFMDDRGPSNKAVLVAELMVVLVVLGFVAVSCVLLAVFLIFACGSGPLSNALGSLFFGSLLFAENPTFVEEEANLFLLAMAQLKVLPKVDRAAFVKALSDVDRWHLTQVRTIVQLDICNLQANTLAEQRLPQHASEGKEKPTIVKRKELADELAQLLEKASIV